MLLSYGSVDILFPYSIYPAGDRALTIDLGAARQEQVHDMVLTIDACLRSGVWPMIKDIVPAYGSVTVFYDPVWILEKYKPVVTAFEWMKQRIGQEIKQYTPAALDEGRELNIPVCYEPLFAPDMDALVASTGLSAAAIIGIHTAVAYKVYMIGFLPGFPYMGMVDERIAMGRKAQPVPVQKGSVGIAGMQTGIYPLDSPGGWQIIGRTPLALFDAEREEPCLLQPGDRVRFYAITKDEFDHYTGRTT